MAVWYFARHVPWFWWIWCCLLRIARYSLFILSLGLSSCILPIFFFFLFYLQNFKNWINTVSPSFTLNIFSFKKSFFILDVKNPLIETFFFPFNSSWSSRMSFWIYYIMSSLSVNSFSLLWIERLKLSIADLRLDLVSMYFDNLT